MSWTAPTTNVAGTLITASWGNSDVRDNTLALRATPDYCCSAYHNTTQTVTAGNTTALNLNSEELDTAAMHDTSTNNNRVNFVVGGRFFVYGRSPISVGGVGTLHLRNSAATTLRSSEAWDRGTFAQDKLLVVQMYISTIAADWVELAGQAVTNNCTFGSATAAQATRLDVVGPLPYA